MRCIATKKNDKTRLKRYIIKNRDITKTEARNNWEKWYTYKLIGNSKYTYSIFSDYDVGVCTSQ